MASLREKLIDKISERSNFAQLPKQINFAASPQAADRNSCRFIEIDFKERVGNTSASSPNHRTSFESMIWFGLTHIGHIVFFASVRNHRVLLALYLHR